ncbi:hypothetical protein X777_06705, partial [Ooceraea biroi]
SVDSKSGSDQNINFKTFLANWAVAQHISQSSLCLLLNGIKQYTCQNCSFGIPSDPRSLLHTPRNTYTDVCGDVNLKSIHTKGPLIESCYNPQYRTMKCSNSTIRINTLADNCCELRNGNIIEVKNIAYCKELNTNVIIGNEFYNKKDLYDIPCPLSLIGIFIVEKLSELKIWPVEDVKTKYVKLPFKDNKFAVFPLIHQ